jgi:Sulfotransferase domain
MITSTSSATISDQGTRQQHPLPNLILIGAMKCGTSSLHQYLNLHPQIQMSSQKELDFFVAHKNWSKGLDWYRQQFSGSTKIIGESSPNYTKYPIFPGVPERMHQIVPHAKLIYLVRNPVQRLLSHYLHQYTNRDEIRSFAQVLKDLEQSHYWQTSCYGLQLERFLRYYDRSQILVISLESLAQNRLQVLQQIFRFLTVDDQFTHPDFTKVTHRSQDKKRLTAFGAWLYSLPKGGRLAQIIPYGIDQAVTLPEIASKDWQLIQSHLQADIDYFRQLSGQAFPEWSL